MKQYVAKHGGRSGHIWIEKGPEDFMKDTPRPTASFNLEKTPDPFIDPEPVDIPVRDENDRIFLELAATRPLVDFLITGDQDFERQQYADVPVISAAFFVKTVLT